jgi:hypothetical protein
LPLEQHHKIEGKSIASAMQGLAGKQEPNEKVSCPCTIYPIFLCVAKVMIIHRKIIAKVAIVPQEDLAKYGWP